MGEADKATNDEDVVIVSVKEAPINKADIRPPPVKTKNDLICDETIDDFVTDDEEDEDDEENVESEEFGSHNEDEETRDPDYNDEDENEEEDDDEENEDEGEDEEEDEEAKSHYSDITTDDDDVEKESLPVITFSKLFDIKRLFIFFLFHRFFTVQVETFIHSRLWKQKPYKASINSPEEANLWMYRNVFPTKESEIGVIKLTVWRTEHRPKTKAPPFKDFKDLKLPSNEQTGNDEMQHGLTAAHFDLINKPRWLFIHVIDLLEVQRVFETQLRQLEGTMKVEMQKYVSYRQHAKTTPLKKPLKPPTCEAEEAAAHGYGHVPMIDQKIKMKKWTKEPQTVELRVRLRPSHFETSMHYQIAYFDTEKAQDICSLNLAPETLARIFNNLDSRELIRFKRQLSNDTKA